MDSKFEKELLQEIEKQRFQKLSHQLTSTCWDRCVSKISNKLDSNMQRCIENCVGRYIDVSSTVNEKQNESRFSFTSVDIA